MLCLLDVVLDGSTGCVDIWMGRPCLDSKSPVGWFCSIAGSQIIFLKEIPGLRRETALYPRRSKVPKRKTQESMVVALLQLTSSYYLCSAVAWSNSLNDDGLLTESSSKPRRSSSRTSKPWAWSAIGMWAMAKRCQPLPPFKIRLLYKFVCLWKTLSLMQYSLLPELFNNCVLINHSLII